MAQGRWRFDGSATARRRPYASDTDGQSYKLNRDLGEGRRIDAIGAWSTPTNPNRFDPGR